MLQPCVCSAEDVEWTALLGDLQSVQEQLSTKPWKQDELDMALVCAVVLQQLHKVELLLHHDADPCSFDGAAMGWAQQIAQSQPEDPTKAQSVLSAVAKACQHESPVAAPSANQEPSPSRPSQSALRTIASSVGFTLYCLGKPEQIQHLVPAGHDSDLPPVHTLLANLPLDQRSLLNSMEYVKQEYSWLFLQQSATPAADFEQVGAWPNTPVHCGCACMAWVVASRQG